MARPRKGTEEVWYDTFSAWPEDDRAAALKVLTHLHRALLRVKGRTAEPEPEQQQIEADPDQTEDLTAGYNNLPGAAEDARMSMRRSNGGA